MIYYLFDASALILFYQKADKQLDDIFIRKAKNEAFVYLPQFCVPEVFNAFEKIHFREKSISLDIYKAYCEGFKKDVMSRSVIYCYDLHRYHNLNSHEIIKYEHTIPYQAGEKSLSALDILVISMGVELMRIHPPKNVFLVTADKRMRTICKACPTRFPQVVYVYDRRTWKTAP